MLRRHRPVLSGIALVAACSEEPTDPFANLHHPADLQVTEGDWLVLENARDSTSFGGRARITRFPRAGGPADIVVDEPEGFPTAVLELSDGRIVVGSSGDTIPGDEGFLSVVEDGRLQEVAQVATSVSDLVEEDGALYVLGTNDDGDSLYRCALDDIASPERVAGGLGRMTSLTFVDGIAYVTGVADEAGVHRLDPGGGWTTLSDRASFGMAAVGGSLVYSDFDARTVRRLSPDGLEDTAVTEALGPGYLTGVAADPETGEVWVLSVGTSDFEFQDGRLIALGPVAP